MVSRKDFFKKKLLLFRNVWLVVCVCLRWESVLTWAPPAVGFSPARASSGRWTPRSSAPAADPASGYHCTHTHTHTHTHVGFCGLRGLSIGVMVFILNKLCVLLPYTYPTPKLSPHRRLCAFLDFQKKHHLVCFLSLLNYGDIGSVLIKHLQIVIPLSYPCY